MANNILWVVTYNCCFLTKVGYNFVNDIQHSGNTKAQNT